jgi:hypothetical protein
MTYYVEMVSDGRRYMPSVMKIGSVVQVTAYYLCSLRGCSVGITDLNDL